MEDIENTAKKHERKRQAIQLPPALHRAVKLEINARFERGGGKVTQGDVLIEAWDAYMRHRVESPVSTDPSPVERGQKSAGRLPERHRNAHALLQQILDTNDKEAIDGIESNMKLFVEALKSRTGTLPRLQRGGGQ
jgi:hypothetical protein